MHRLKFDHLGENCSTHSITYKDEWVCKGSESWFDWKLDRPLKKGWYRLYLSGCLNGVGLPKVYFDRREGYNELFSASLYRLKGKKNVYTSVVEITSDVIGIRLVPLEGHGTCNLNSFRIVQLNSLQVLHKFLSKAFNIVTTDFKNAPGRLTRAIFSLISGQRLRILSLSDTKSTPQDRYAAWIENYDYDRTKNRESLIKRTGLIATHPKISILLAVDDTKLELINETIQSIVDQIYKNWELYICCDIASTDTKIMLNSLAEKDERIKIVYSEESMNLSIMYNQGLAFVNSDWVAICDSDCVLREHALAHIVSRIDLNPNVGLIYSDEDKIDAKGRRFDPHFKPDFSIHLMRSFNYLGHFTVHRLQNIIAANAWNPQYHGVQNYDLNMRVIEKISQKSILHINEVLYHIRVCELKAKQKCVENDSDTHKLKSLIHDHHRRQNNKVDDVSTIGETSLIRTTYSIPITHPLISIIIPTKDKVGLLSKCIESILEKTTYTNYEIMIVDNNSIRDDTAEFLNKTIMENENISCLKYDKAFNYSAINNFAAKHAKGEYLCLLNNDVEVITPSWLGEMVSLASQERSGCVGAKLYYGNNTIQHAGVILGLGGVAGHSHKNFPRDSMGYFSRLKTVQNLSAVTAACLLVSKSIYNEMGGLNEVDLTVAFNDVDFCLRVQEAGYQNIWTPFAELFHYESLSRGEDISPEKSARFQLEIQYMIKRWKNILYNDPYYSKNLTHENEDFSIRN